MLIVIRKGDDQFVVSAKNIESLTGPISEHKSTSVIWVVGHGEIDLTECRVELLPESR